VQGRGYRVQGAGCRVEGMVPCEHGREVPAEYAAREGRDRGERDIYRQQVTSPLRSTSAKTVVEERG